MQSAAIPTLLLFPLSTMLGFKLSQGVQDTITPPFGHSSLSPDTQFLSFCRIPSAYTWAAAYPTSQPHGPLLDMSQGVPGDPPDAALVSALGIASTSLQNFGYCPSEGELSLRQAIAKEMKAVYGNETGVVAEDMSLTAGCNMAFVAAIVTLADAGDEVILPVPWYFNHQMTLSMLGITTVPLETRAQDGFMPSVERCKLLISSKTRAIALVTPNNPTGATYPPSLLTSFSELARESGVALIIDETYRDFITPASPPHSLFSSTAWRSHLIHLFSFSKSYAVPGHRLGLVVASPAFQKPLGKVLDTLQICAPRPIQLALAPLLDAGGLRASITETAARIHARHQLFRASVPSIWKVATSGGYFAFVRHPFVGRGSKAVAQRLAEEIGVVVLPGAFFRDEKKVEQEDDRWVRFSVANCDEERIIGVCRRLEACVAVFGWAVDA
ncbi:Aminotransferase class I and II [Mycena indigotica]|uniref:Aminotransferase class I and II n=1 Tax=Mycena indigotica TaxID=2126181 RepID=A0A8H6VY89_9AGAR|nr:Aminotransferase class I and II [Mycena indigotica]KAF7292569.1 Aminotransferase class I and II [Mycena indigotica]